MRDGNAVDASLAPASRALIERIAALQSPNPDQLVSAASLNEKTSSPISSAESLAAAEIELSDTQHPDQDQYQGRGQVVPEVHYERIEVPLVFDSEFFDILQSDVNNLDALQAKEERAMVAEIVALRQDVSHLTKPSRLSKSDLARWRAIFELYLDAQVFFSTHEQDHGSRNSQTAAKQLQWFQEEITKRNLVKSFKIAESREALVRFLRLNAVLLKNLQFQEINQVAIYKILKSESRPFLYLRRCNGLSYNRADYHQNSTSGHAWGFQNLFQFRFTLTSCWPALWPRIYALKCPPTWYLLYPKLVTTCVLSALPSPTGPSDWPASISSAYDASLRSSVEMRSIAPCAGLTPL